MKRASGSAIPAFTAGGAPKPETSNRHVRNPRGVARRQVVLPHRPGFPVARGRRPHRAASIVEVELVSSFHQSLLLAIHPSIYRRKQMVLPLLIRHEAHAQNTHFDVTVSVAENCFQHSQRESRPLGTRWRMQRWRRRSSGMHGAGWCARYPPRQIRGHHSSRSACVWRRFCSAKTRARAKEAVD